MFHDVKSDDLAADSLFQNISLNSGIFLGLIWVRILAPSQLKIEQKLPKMVYIIPNFLVLQFGENFVKIQTKIAKLQIHTHLHKNVNETGFHSHFYSNMMGDYSKKYVTALHC